MRSNIELPNQFKSLTVLVFPLNTVLCLFVMTSSIIVSYLNIQLWTWMNFLNGIEIVGIVSIQSGDKMFSNLGFLRSGEPCFHNTLASKVFTSASNSFRISVLQEEQA